MGTDRDWRIVRGEASLVGCAVRVCHRFRHAIRQLGAWEHIAAIRCADELVDVLERIRYLSQRSRQ